MSFEDGSTLRDFLTLFSMNRSRSALIRCRKCCERISRGLKRFQQANPVGKAQQNVAHHYDLGNDFYKLFLDKGMQYSCAYFINDDDTLEEAQRNKLRLIAVEAAAQARPEDPRYRQRLGRSRALSRGHGRRGRHRRHAVERAIRTLQREGAACRTCPIACASSCATTARWTGTLRPHRLGRHVRACGRASLRRVLRTRSTRCSTMTASWCCIPSAT